MISYLRGAPRCFLPQGVIFVVGGLGYTVLMTGEDLRLLEKAWQEHGALGAYELWIENLVRENAQELFGFLHPLTQEWFRWLLAVPGVGGRMALNLLSCCPPQVLCACILQNNVDFLCKADGIGKKLAQRVVQELQKKALTWQATHGAAAQGHAPGGSFQHTPFFHTSAYDESLQALCALGYKRDKAQEALESFLASYGDKALPKAAEMVRGTLQYLATSQGRDSLHDAPPAEKG